MQLGTRSDLNSFVGEAVRTELGHLFTFIKYKGQIFLTNIYLIGGHNTWRAVFYFVNLWWNLLQLDDYLLFYLLNIYLKVYSSKMMIFNLWGKVKWKSLDAHTFCFWPSANLRYYIFKFILKYVEIRLKSDYRESGLNPG